MALFAPPIDSRALNNRTTRYMIDTFLGYNATLRPSENQWADEENLSSDSFPVCAQRKKRSYKSGTQLQGMIAKDALVYVDNEKLYKNGAEVSLGTLSLTESEKTLVSFGAWVLIFPDKIMYNTVTDEVKAMQKSFVSSGTVTYSMARVDGETFDNIVYSDTEPTGPNNGDYWLDTSSVPNALKQWSANTAMWVEISSTYIKIANPGIGQKFDVYDGITISNSVVGDLNNTMVIWAKGDNYIVVSGIINDVITQDQSNITVEKNLPDMDFCIEANNRLWGCKYGQLSQNGPVVNEIYASKLGDPTNFNVFMGTAADSYSVSLGTDGVFTGAANYLGYPIFFKEDCIHKVYGQYPANFQVQTTKARGVQRGCSKSIVLVDERLYYKSTVDVCVYDGSLPGSVSDDLGDGKYKNAVAGSLGKKYYFAAREANDTDLNPVWRMFVFDTQKGIWHRETAFPVLQFTRLDDLLLAIDKQNNRLVSMTGGKGNITGWSDEQSLSWSALSGKVGYSMPDKKYPLRLNFRLLLHSQSSVTLSVSYDDGTFIQVGSLTNAAESDEIKALALIPHRCHHFEYKLEGTGRTEIVSVTKTMAQGSDR